MAYISKITPLGSSESYDLKAAKLVTARSLKTKLDSTTAVTFDGSADQNAIPVTGTLPIENGGTGATTAAGARTNLEVMRYINTTDNTTWTADTLGATTSVAFTRNNITGAHATGHIVWLNANDIGTPFQLVVHDSSELYFWKRWKNSGTWTSWTKMNAGYADSAGSLNNQVRTFGNISYSMTGSGTTTDNETNRKAFIKYICDHYSNAALHIGTYSPNSLGPCIGNIYDVSDTSNGCPRYSTFIYHNLEGGLVSFGTSNYNYYERTYVYNSGTWGISITGNAATATALSTSGTAAKFWRGDNTWSNTLTGNLLLSKDANTAWANAPALQLTGANSKIASIKLTNSGTNLDIGWDWTAREGAGLGLRSTSATDKPGGFYLFARNATENHELIGTVGGDLTWSGLLKITNNSNTTTIGSQNASFCHIYNSVNIPFIFNNSVLTTGGNLGDSTYPFDNLTLGRSNGAGIYYKGTKATYRMIRFIDNTSDTYGNGISIGGGGQTIIGGGESADTAAAQAGTAGAEIMQVCNDGDVQIISNLQDGWANRKVSTFNATGNLTLPAKLICANSGNTTGGSYTESGLEIREYNYAGASSDTWGNAPRMTFHWGGRIQAQIGLASNNWLYTTSGYGGDLTTNAHRFVIEQGGTWNISVSGNAATATSSQAVLSGGTIGSSSTTHATALKNWFDSNKASTPRNQLIAFYDVSSGNGSLTFGYFLTGYDSNPYGGFYCAHYNTPYYIGISSGTYTQSQIWKKGDAVTGAVWNDYAEYREATPDSTTPGYVVFENGDDTLSLTTERLQHFAGITSDTWGFAQGETEKAKTPIAVSGRVLAYTYRDRNEYKPGDCVCAAPGGTIDIMTREEIREWPDRIVGTVSCVPEYDEWGGGELADRPPVKVNGRIWIKVR